MIKSINGSAMVMLVAATLLVSSFLFLGSTTAATSSASPIVDGTVTPGEYGNMAAFSGDSFHLYWQVEGGLVFFAMSSRTSGYLGVGFDPEFMMKGADMVVGWVDPNGTAFVHDAYSSGQFGPVEMDIDLGGTDDLEEFAGKANDGVVTIEFSRPLSTGDIYDNDIPSDGELVVIWATGSEYDPGSLPNNAGMGVINMASGDSGNMLSAYPFYLLGLALALAASIMAVFLVRRRGRDRAHLILGTIATLSLVGTFLLVFATDPYLAMRHGPWTVAVPLVLFVIAVLLGFVATRTDRRARWQRLHLWSAGAAMASLVLTLVLALLP